ncbi:AAA family ATPase [Clostridium estertheticum]|uniref:AAA family ATPase n=1 Tax=Clostridium estertheticum TaxID=238834 RepID=UPI001C0AD097|nr:AAA family ATPase [Clostridium estertheticum]MBU3199424.1 AAA family ATPase [Clostridium estertheticum]WAG67332.1 AAA family ATPase [Clostridium estertheticum]
MTKTIIRIQSIELTGFKNIQEGIIDLSGYRQKKYYSGKSDIIGIYGQNGSGKTTIVEAFKLFKIIASGEKLPEDIKNYIHELEDAATLKFVFYIELKDQKLLVYYQLSLRRKEGLAELYNEKLSYSQINEDNKKRKIDIIEYLVDLKDTYILPKARYNELIRNNKENEFNLEVGKRLSIKEKTSFIFNDSLEEIFKSNSMSDDYFNVINVIKHFARVNLFVITNEHSATISLNYMPLSFRMEDEACVTSGDIAINLLGTSNIDKKRFDIATRIIKQLNIVLSTIIPNLQLEINNLGNELSKNGKEVVRIQLLSIKKDIKIPLKYESEGIKKIISILSTLISMFNNPSICLIVDELDAGIFEYLLGELLKIIEQEGKGQFIFTSHNLRPLEMLEKESLVFSTSNPQNRFIRITNIKSNNNLRNVYLRGVDLGGLNECIYEETNSFEIAHAFRKAGDILYEE